MIHSLTGSRCTFAFELPEGVVTICCHLATVLDPVVLTEQFIHLDRRIREDPGNVFKHQLAIPILRHRDTEEARIKLASMYRHVVGDMLGQSLPTDLTYPRLWPFALASLSTDFHLHPRFCANTKRPLGAEWSFTFDGSNLTRVRLRLHVSDNSPREYGPTTLEDLQSALVGEAVMESLVG